MAIYDESSVYGLTQGCPDHGENAMADCGLCGTEYCRMCYSSNVCAECFEQQQLDEDEEENSDFEDVKNLGALIGEDQEVEKILEESEQDFPPDMFEED